MALQHNGQRVGLLDKSKAKFKGCGLKAHLNTNPWLNPILSTHSLRCWFLCTLIFFVSSARFGSVETLHNDPWLSLTYDPVSTECLAKECYWDIFGLSTSLDDSPQQHLNEPTANCWDAPQISHNSICYLPKMRYFTCLETKVSKVQYFLF